ncbi:hypothetical protein [Pseudomonas alabamensis]|uniref:hypothetical protein n=1 Tax=Pseudomonas alabamensis TaxID=3064349 RepID=UPI003F6502BB
MAADSLHEVQALVASDTYQDGLLKIRGIANIEIEPAYEGVLVNLDLTKLARAQIDAGDISRTLGENGQQIISYSIAKLNLMSSDDENNGEHPPGEEPESHDRSKTISASTYSQGFLLTNTIEYLLGTDSPEKLLAYLKLSRIPHAKKYAGQILELITLHGDREEQ